MAARTVLIIFLSVQFSLCPTPPRMVRYFGYNTSQTKAMEISRRVLEDLGYNIDLYTKESYMIKTAVVPVKQDIRRYDYALAVLVEDYVQVFIIAQKQVFKRGSEISLGGDKSITEADAVDWLPYTVQQKIFLPLVNEYRKYGIKKIQIMNAMLIPENNTINA
ncbi:MAG TPA: hypothetical protein QGF08_03425 [Candidatus Marinimicrobia bacterium]|jgi:hypothetical protein|nr:hypothetical protein [Candidatus Neomarinimicrobiota bacterium]HJM69914.1 hypothetical protein [Candidatus Neomarinimicrobiota bacterium]|tara:strand:+ start:9324 stop:9812 length:489 start_codon:yes stop_codon:yes gene_type:complete